MSISAAFRLLYIEAAVRSLKYLAGIWAAVAVYTFFSFMTGPGGISSYNYLLNEKDRQLDNIKNLGMMNEELERTRNNLLYDQDTLLVHAHQMGYGYEDERFIRIVGLSNTSTLPAAAGSVYSAQHPDFISDRSIKIAALCVGLLFFTFLLMLEFIERRTR